jgi:hypothetical protein
VSPKNYFVWALLDRGETCSEPGRSLPGRTSSATIRAWAPVRPVASARFSANVELKWTGPDLLGGTSSGPPPEPRDSTRPGRARDPWSVGPDLFGVPPDLFRGELEPPETRGHALPPDASCRFLPACTPHPPPGHQSAGLAPGQVPARRRRARPAARSWRSPRRAHSADRLTLPAPLRVRTADDVAGSGLLELEVDEVQ